MLIGGVEEGIDTVLSIIESKSNTRKETVNTAMTSAASMGYMSYPIEVTVGGATVFVIDIERFVKY